MAKQTGMIKEITNLYVILDIQGKELKVRYLYNDNIRRFKNEDLVNFETEERESKEDPAIKYLWFKEITYAEAPKPSDAFKTEMVSHPSKTLPGVEVEETVKVPATTQRVTTIEYPTKDIIMARGSALKSAVAYYANSGEKATMRNISAVVETAKKFEEYILRKD